MTVTVRLFAVMAQSAETRLVTLDVPEHSNASAIRHQLHQRFPQMPWPTGTMLAINQEYAGEQTPLSEGDEVAIIPPVSGG